MLVALICAIFATPLTIAILAWRDEHAFRALAEANAVSLDRLLTHSADTQSPGEPSAVTKQKLAVASADIAAKVEVAKLRAVENQFDPLRD